MNFFEQQERARHHTKLLVLLFLAGLFGITLVLSGVASVAFGQPFDLTLYAAVALPSVAIICLGSLFKSAQLRSGGGHAVAESLGGRLIPPSTTDFNERRLLNVVEEMAIASGVPVPAVYLMEEEGINAFAAGYRPEEAVIGVTRGCVERLNREQLQGVMAHEFSHILNGDMNLNIRLVGVLFGLLMIAMIGRIIFYGAGRSRGYSSRGGRDGGAGGVILFGIALFIIGYIGVLFGNLIKAAISRRREFLADASAVQFTRNPDGIAGALKAIGAYAYGSKIENAHADEASHMLFGSAGASLVFDSPSSSRTDLEDRSAVGRRVWSPSCTAAKRGGGLPKETTQISSRNGGPPRWSRKAGDAPIGDRFCSTSSDSTSSSWICSFRLWSTRGLLWIAVEQ